MYAPLRDSASCVTAGSPSSANPTSRASGPLCRVDGAARRSRYGEPALDQLEQQAIRAAAERVAPSVVKIETVGGLERIGNVRVGTGPTTGLIVSPDGYIVSSAFNFAARPSSILVGLADGTRTPAKLIATDHQRMLVLLKIHVDEQLPVPEAVPEDEHPRRPVGDRARPHV